MVMSLLVGGASGAEDLVTRAARDELVFMRDESSAMRQAFDKASRTLNDFLAKARAAKPEHTAFALKVAVSEGDNTEYFWVSHFSELADGRFVGEIDNDARMVKTVKLGQRYVFPRSRVVDWTYIDRGRHAMVGNFTLCALLTQEKPADAEAAKQKFGLDCSWLQ
jgi:uncharacterized protein YegJ (DUF2314 family)